MWENAKTPERVHDKLAESRYFLEQMAKHEKDLDPEEFLFCLSAFLSAFRSTAYRLYGVTENMRGAAAKQRLREQLHHHPDIGFLIERGNVEVHSDGARVWKRYMPHYEHPVPSNRGSRFDREAERFHSRFKVPNRGLTVASTVVDWQFHENPKSLIDLGQSAVNAMEEHVRSVPTPS